MSTNLTRVKTTGLVKTSEATRMLSTRVQRAFDARNLKVERADAELKAAIKRAIEATEEDTVDGTPAEPPTDVPEQAAS